MSQLLINDYLKQLDLIKKISGSRRETIVREAFKDLLKAWGKQQGLVFLAEYPLKTATKSNIMVDGALLHELRMPLGYWEAKDESDDLAEEISKKLKKGYPQDNIIFSDDATAVLWQNRNEVLRCDMTDTHALARLLKLFFSFERPEIAGFRAAVEQFKADLPAVLQALREMIEREHKSNAKFRKAEQKFLAHAQEAINPSLTDADVREMLIQHILTEEIFAKVFDDSDFHQHNNVARELYALEGEFFTGSLKKQTLKGLETYYAAIRAAAAQISSHHEKQTFLKVIYENFYKVYNTKAADRLDVVYTPNEIVRFMIDGADWLTEKHFSKNLIDKDVEILDPATGTGTFICELLEHFRGQPAKLKYKYLNELHANEVAILPYYVANLNIEATYAAITGNYEEFPNLCFVDTLDNVGLHTAAKGTTADIFGSVSEENVARIKRQNSKRISVIIGNPPYNANQLDENDNNKNRESPSIDKRIKQTYIFESTAQKTKLYDMYARFFRWASDRLNENGVLAFVTNRSFIESRTFDGFRKTVAQEFSDIYEVELGGDIRALSGLDWIFLNEKHTIFGKATKTAAKDRAIFKLYSLGVNTDRDEWVYDLSIDTLKAKISYFIKRYNANLKDSEHDYSIKWSSSLVAHKEAIFHYCYAVLHDPLYREKYALNLKRKFPRIPFYADFWQWAAWGEALMKLHISYEAVEPFALKRIDIPDEKVRASGLQPKAMLRADKDAGSIALDTETTLRGIPPEAWDYKLGNRCALEWVLDQYKEKKPKDPTIREKFDTYRFADYKEKVIDLLARVTTVSVETERITQAMKAAAR